MKKQETKNVARATGSTPPQRQAPLEPSPDATLGDGDGAARPSLPNNVTLLKPQPAVPVEILLNLGATFGAQQIAAMMGEMNEALVARGVMAGIVATLQEILPTAQFRNVMIQWEIDGFKLTDLLALTATNEGIQL